MPTTEVPAVDLERGVPLLDLLVQTGLAPSKGEARRLVQQGGITVNDAVVSDAACTIATKDLKNGEVVLRKGKKNWHRIIVG
jgi:tyrosyl-tRNA synthetase